MSIQENNFVAMSIDSRNPVYLVEQFKNVIGKKEISIASKSTIHYLAIIDQESKISLSFITQGSEATIHIYALLLGQKGTQIEADIHAHLHHDNTTAHMHLISFLPNQASITLDGGVSIHPNICKGSGHLLEENIILGEGVQIKTLPMLDVQSNDVSASHGARIEKLDAKKLFYAQSRGLSESEAKGLLVLGYFHQCFSSFIDQDDKLEDLQQQLYIDLMNRE